MANSDSAINIQFMLNITHGHCILSIACSTILAQEFMTCRFFKKCTTSHRCQKFKKILQAHTAAKGYIKSVLRSNHKSTTAISTGCLVLPGPKVPMPSIQAFVVLNLILSQPVESTLLLDHN